MITFLLPTILMDFDDCIPFRRRPFKSYMAEVDLLFARWTFMLVDDVLNFQLSKSNFEESLALNVKKRSRRPVIGDDSSHVYSFHSPFVGSTESFPLRVPDLELIRTIITQVFSARTLAVN